MYVILVYIIYVYPIQQPAHDNALTIATSGYE